MLCFVTKKRARRRYVVRQIVLVLSIGLAASICLTPASLADPLGSDSGLAQEAPRPVDPNLAPLMELQRQGREFGDAWSETVTPQSPDYDALSDIDFPDLREKALNHPRVRALLDAGSQQTGSEGQGDVRYEGGRLFLLASFSIPGNSLRQMLHEAEAFGVPVIFRGFRNNSVYETQDVIIETFGSLEAAKGFVIDPTVFQRFQVEGVPLLIGAGSSLDQCETPGCIDDPIPPHDAVRGNVPLQFALQLMAERGEHAANAATAALERSGNRVVEVQP